MSLDLDKLKAELIRDEGVVPHAYQDHLGYWTIGVGRLVDKRKGGGLSDEEIAVLLDNDIRRKSSDLDGAVPWWRDLDPVRQRVLVNLCFQLGISGLLGFKNTLAALQRGDYKAAADGLRASKLYQQTPARTERRARMIETGQD
jgi:lysozyme